MLGANARAFTDKRAAPDGVVLRENGEAVFCAFVARIEIVALGESDGGRTGEQRIEAVDGASGVAEHAVDAHTVLLVGVELLGRLQVLTFGERLFFFAEEPGRHAPELAHGSGNR